MRICLYTCSALPKMGGQEFVVDALARQFLSMGHEPTVLAPSPRESHKAFDRKLPYRMLRHPRFVSTHRLVSWYRAFLSRAQDKHNFDIVHCHDVHPSAYLAAMVKEKTHVPLVITSHGGDVKEGNVRLSKPGLPERYVYALKSADAIVSIGKFTEESIRRIYPDAGRMIYIPNGVDFNSFRPPVSRPTGMDERVQPQKYILFIGRLKDRKGVDVLVDAVSKLPRDSDIKFVLAGTGEQESSLREQISRLKLEDRVILIGRVTGEAKVWVLQNCICVVIPSRDWEAFPLVVLESYAAAKCVIASDIPGLRDLIEVNKTGWLVPPENADALASRLAYVLQNPAECSAWGANAHDLARSFDWPVVAQKHIDLYNSLLKQ